MSRRRRRQRHRQRLVQHRLEKKRTNALGLGILVAAAVGTFALVQWVQLRGPGRRELNAHLPRCPVGGTPVNFAVSMTTEAGPVYFCCAHCVQKLEASPATYASAVVEQREFLSTMARVQVCCPVSGKMIKPDIPLESAPGTVWFCSDECRARYAADPAAYRAALAASYSYQVKCPVSGDPIAVAHSANLQDSYPVYFCSSECRAAFLDDPAAYKDALADQGVRWSP